MKPQGPPILPMYKVASNQRKKGFDLLWCLWEFTLLAFTGTTAFSIPFCHYTGGGLISILIAVLLPIVVLFLLVFFFLSIYIGSSYLQEHLQVRNMISVSIGSSV